MTSFSVRTVRLYRSCPGAIGSVVAAWILSGCAATEPRQPVPQTVVVPAQWISATNSGAPIDEWWRSFGNDPLNLFVSNVLERNHDLRAAAARVEDAALEARIAGAALLPTLDAGLNAERSQRAFVGLPIPGASGGVLKSRSSSFGVSLVSNWEIDLWGRLRAGKRAAMADFESSEAAFKAARLSLAAQAAKVWLALTEAELQVRLAQRTLGAYERIAREVRVRYASGIRSPLDVRLALANEAAARAHWSERQAAVEHARRQVEILRGDYPVGTAGGGDTLPDAPAEVPSGLPSELLQRRPDLVQAERQLAAAAARVQEARAALFPRLALTASGGTATAEFTDLLDQDFSVWALGANVAQPIFSGGRLRAGVAQNRARQREATELYASSILTAFREVETGLAIDGWQREREARWLESVEHARAAATLAESRYRAGLEDIITVLEARRRSAEAESQALAVRRQRLENRIDLHLALGGGFAAEPTRDSSSLNQ